MNTLEATNMAEITAGQISSLVSQLEIDPSQYHLSLSNIRVLQRFFLDQKTAHIPCYIDHRYTNGEVIVKEGSIINSPLTYSHVPLGFILSGEVTITKGGKATKTLGTGDFIGLFETSDWLLTNQKRHIGDWTLTATQATEIIYFPADALQKPDESTEALRNYLIEIARADIVPQPITTQPLLDWIASETTPSRLSDYAIVVHTHLLPTSYPFFRHLAYLCGFGKIFFMEKPYSTIRSTYNDLIQSGCEVVQVRMEPGVPYAHAVQKSTEILWTKVIEEQRKSGFKKLLVIDDGGELWTSLPWEQLAGVDIAGVEQTQRGIDRIQNTSHHIPSVISVATSGVKKQVEPIFIGQAIVNRLQELNLLDKRIGILGKGSIGVATANALEKLGIHPLFYDPQATDGTRSAIDTLFNDSDLIIGATGTDSLKGVALERIHGHKTLVSTSSTDVEFLSLLKLAGDAAAPFETQHVEVHPNFTVDILNGGFPLNFDRENNTVPGEDIVLTWCLMYIGAMQAVNLLENNTAEEKIYGLDQSVQKKVLERWIENKEEQSPVNKQQAESIISQTSP